MRRVTYSYAALRSSAYSSHGAACVTWAIVSADLFTAKGLVIFGMTQYVECSVYTPVSIGILYSHSCIIKIMRKYVTETFRHFSIRSGRGMGMSRERTSAYHLAWLPLSAAFCPSALTQTLRRLSIG